jgi:hypothetical protein
VNDGILASIFWVAAVFCWILLAYGWKENAKAAAVSVLGPVLFATGFAIFLTVRAVLS